MRTAAIALLTALMLSACPHGAGRTYDAFHGKDSSMPKLLEYGLVDNEKMRLVYDEDVVLLSIALNGTILPYSMSGTIFTIPFPSPLERGESALFTVTAEDGSGNTSRTAIRIIGKNMDIPSAVINEISAKGTAENPDRIEILFLEAGSPAGMIVSDGIIGEENHMVVLPDIEVKPKDTAVIYWDREPKSTDPILSNGHTGYIVDGGSDTTLAGTNGAVLLYAELDGEVIDGVIYTSGENEDADGYGTNRTKNAANLLKSQGKWYGEPVSSVLMTASRVIARLPGGQDTDTKDDFFITEARKSTFGRPNEYFPYDE